MSETDNAENAAPAQPQITLVNLGNLLRIIDAAAERGAFRGNELTSVGQERDILANFLQAVAPQAEAEEPAPMPVEQAAPAPAKKSRAARK